MWGLPGPEIEPVSPALAGRFLTTVPPGNPINNSLLKWHNYLNMYFIKDCIEMTNKHLTNKHHELFENSKLTHPWVITTHTLESLKLKLWQNEVLKRLQSTWNFVTASWADIATWKQFGNFLKIKHYIYIHSSLIKWYIYQEYMNYIT